MRNYHIGSTPVVGAERAEMLAAAEPIAISQGVAPNLLRAVCEVESNYRPRPGDGGKSIGLCQVKPETALLVTRNDLLDGASTDEKLKHIRERLHDDWRYNISIAARLLRRYIDRYGSEELALIAYNGGENHALLRYATKVKAVRNKLESSRSSGPIQLSRSNDNSADGTSTKFANTLSLND